jgi:endonuclease/exonuclease/phosphatase family metal-dependent hydrolase
MLSRRQQLLGVVLIVALIVGALVWAAYRTPPAGHVPAAGEEGYFFCFWNVENLFDDHDDRRTGPDAEYDRWFAHDPAALQLKLDRLSEALVRLNDGKGPDILAVVEVENERAADLLRQALNRRLSDESLHYTHLLMKELSAGRHFAPAIITRLPVNNNKTQLHGRALRILEGHVVVNGHDLVILATHWTSQRTDTNGGGRDKYGDQIYGVYQAMWLTNPKVDFLVCGDCNDTPDSVSVTKHLHATGDIESVRQIGGEPQLLNLFAGKDPHSFGTHFFHNQWSIFDQIFVSPGLLDNEGWTCLPDTVRTINTLYRPGDPKRRPWRFGNEKDRYERGYSDHFPVTVRLRVQQ